MNLENALSKLPDARFMESIKAAAAKRPTAEDVLAQRVSFVFGSVDKDNGVTKEHVREVILNLTRGGTQA
jgi:hypothetical protein